MANTQVDLKAAPIQPLSVLIIGSGLFHMLFLASGGHCEVTPIRYSSKSKYHSSKYAHCSLLSFSSTPTYVYVCFIAYCAKTICQHIIYFQPIDSIIVSNHQYHLMAIN